MVSALTQASGRSPLLNKQDGSNKANNYWRTKVFMVRPHTSPQLYCNSAALHSSTRSMALIGQQLMARCSNVNNDEKFRAQSLQQLRYIAARTVILKKNVNFIWKITSNSLTTNNQHNALSAHLVLLSQDACLSLGEFMSICEFYTLLLSDLIMKNRIDKVTNLKYIFTFIW